RNASGKRNCMDSTTACSSTEAPSASANTRCEESSAAQAAAERWINDVASDVVKAFKKHETLLNQMILRAFPPDPSSKLGGLQHTSERAVQAQLDQVYAPHFEFHAGAQGRFGHGGNAQHQAQAIDAHQVFAQHFAGERFHLLLQEPAQTPVELH